MFVITQTLKLDEFDGWQGCWIKFNSCTMGELQEAGFKADGDASENLEKQNKFLEDHFVDGLGWNGKEQVKIQKKDLKDMPLPIYMKCVSFLVEAVKQSTPQS